MLKVVLGRAPAAHAAPIPSPRRSPRINGPIDLAIRSCGWLNAGTLSLELEVNPRTVRRDITYLRDQLHAPVEFDPVRHGYYYRDPSFRLPFFQLTEGELVAAFTGRAGAQAISRHPLREGLARRAFIKMTELLPDAVSVRLDAIVSGSRIGRRQAALIGRHGAA